MKFDASFVDDFVIARSNGMPTYNFVVTIDDMLMEMTDVIRGDDHLSNTPKQIVIYNALGVKHPNFYHVPMINNPEGKSSQKEMVQWMLWIIKTWIFTRSFIKLFSKTWLVK